jgi:hypothetical protein
MARRSYRKADLSFLDQRFMGANKTARDVKCREHKIAIQQKPSKRTKAMSLDPKLEFMLDFANKLAGA